MIVVVIGMLMSLTGGLPAAASQKLSYIVQAVSVDTAARLVEKYDGTVTSRLDIINGVGALLSNDGVAQLRLEKGIVAITLNGSVESSDNNSDGEKDKSKKVTSNLPATDYPNVVGADAVWDEGVTGAGVTVAVLDTGLGGNLTALARTINNKNGRIVAWKDIIDGKNKKPIDPNGHGSHVAGVIANSETGSDGEWNGIAPGVNLAGVRVLDETGAGTYESVISGLQWVLENQERYHIRIVNLSLVSPVQSPYWADPLNQAVTKTWANGITVIVAAGNNGPKATTITVPGNNPYVVTVGAFTDNFTPDDWDDDYIATFSSAGPTLDGFVKPDLVAPGGHILSVVPDDSYMVTQYPDNVRTDHYFSLAGTSQATAVVSGIAALVIAENPSLTPDQVKMRLTASALAWVDPVTNNAAYSMWEQGFGRVNAPDAVFAPITGSANYGMNIKADLAGKTHYEGFTYYDEATGTFRLYDQLADSDPGYFTWAGARGTWAGARGTWAGARGTWAGARGTWAGARGTWAGDYLAWAGARGTWAGARGTWAGARGTWAGARGTWAGARGTWAGGYLTWVGARGTWAGARGTWAGARGTWAGSVYLEPDFMYSFDAGESPNASLSTATISYIVSGE